MNGIRWGVIKICHDNLNCKITQYVPYQQKVNPKHNLSYIKLIMPAIYECLQ
jgi:hypothetical protein